MNFFVKTVPLKVWVNTNSWVLVVASTFDKLATAGTLNASVFKFISANLTSKGLNWFASNSLIWLAFSSLYFSSSNVTWAILPKVSISIIFFAVLIVLWNLSQLGFIEYFTDEYISTIQNIYLSGNEKMAKIFSYIFSIFCSKPFFYVNQV